MRLNRLLLLALLASLSVGVTPSAFAAMFTVNNGGDLPDDDSPTDDAICETVTAGQCTLHAAIDEANEQTGPHTIVFATSVQAVTLTAGLPNIRAEVDIDGVNAMAVGGRVDINGGAVMGVGGANCFAFDSTGTTTGGVNNPDGGQNSTLSNLVIRNCGGDGIVANGHGYTIENNRIGTTPDGMSAAENDGDGIRISGVAPTPNSLPNIQSILDDPPTSFAEIAAFSGLLQAALTAIANPNFITGNLISGNDVSAIELNNAMTVNNIVVGNIIGLSADSLVAIPNTGTGGLAAIDINVGAYGNFIGPGNIISGNPNDGISITGAVVLPNFIAGNLIGPGGAPGLELGNGDNGIDTDATLDDDGMGADNPTGYTLFLGPANVISDNKSDNGGVGLDQLNTDTSGGILVEGEGVRVFGNGIGLFAFPAGAAFGPLDQILDVGNAGNGIVVTTSGHQIGGSEVFEANFILHNNRHGIIVRGSGTVGNVIRGNFIGVAPPTGLDVFNLGNDGEGIAISLASSTIIGGPGDLDDNVIAGNGINGIALRGGATTSGWSNLIQRNQIYGNGVTTPGEGIGIDLEGDCPGGVVDFPGCNDPDPFPDPAGDDPNDGVMGSAYANYGQNRPVVCTGAGVPVAGCTAPGYNAGTGATTSSWTIDTRPSSTLRIEYFALRPDGMSFLYDEMVTTDAAGLPTGGSCVAGICTSSGTPATATDTRGQSIVMTATDLFPIDVPPVGMGGNTPANNTSEISEPAGIPQEIAFNSATYTTGEAAGTTQVTLQRLGNPVGAVSIEVVLAGAPGTATGGGTDYDFVTVNPVSWADGDGTDKTFTFSINNDVIDEANETVNLELQNPTGAIEGTPNAATLTITDNDNPPTISIANNGVAETDATVQLPFTVTLSAVSSFDVVVTYSTTNGSATAPADYTAATNQTVTIFAGDTDEIINIDIAGDLLDEDLETFLVDITATNTTAAGSNLQATGTITDNDPLPLLSINDVGPLAEGNGPGATPFGFTLSLNAVSGRLVTALVTSGDVSDTAIAPGDYTAVPANQVISIPAGMMSVPFTVNVVGDTTFEPLPTETFTVTLAQSMLAPLNATLLDPTGIGTITNDDAAPPAADLSLTKTHAGNFTQGQIGATYTLTVSNSAAAPTDGSTVTVVDTLPPGLTATALTGTGWTCVLGMLTCTRTDVLAVSTSYAPITLTVNVAGNATTPQDNMATVTGGGDASPGNNTAIDSTVITGAPATPDLSITKSHVGNFTQGQIGATYTITVSNSAAAPTDGSTVTVVDTLPPGLTATALTGTGWTCVLGTLTCTRTDVLAVSTSYAPITLTVNVAGNATTPQVNMANVSGGGDASPGNNSASDSTTVDPAAATPDLSLTKTHVGNFTQGQAGATYTITVSNSAAAATNGSTVTVTDTLPAGLTATALTGTGWTCVLGTLTCTRTDVLAVSTSYAPITLTVNVAGNATTPQVNMANVSGGGDASPGNNSASDSTTVDPAAATPDLSITKTHVGNFTQGQAGATYTITVSNSAAAATNGSTVTVTDTLPAGLTATALTGTGWTCVLGTLTCTRTDVLAVSTSYAPITLTVNVAGNATTPQDNMATVTGGGDASPGNNTAIDSTVITGAPATPDLSITKSHVGNFTQGQIGATYTITVSNSAAAPTDGSTVTVVDTLPPGLTATALTGTGWTCVLGTLTCTRTDVLAVSTSYAPITLTVNVAGNATTPQVNMANVSGGGDASPGNNSASDSTTVDPAAATPDLSITKTHVGNFTQGQAGATYTITVSNSAAAATNGSTVTVTDTLPPGLTATALTGTGWTCVLGTLTCTRTDVLAVSTSYAPITLTVNVAGNATTPQDNMATVTGGGDASPGNNTAIDSTVITGAPATPDLSITKSHVGNFTQGQIGATYTITVSNSAAAPTDGSTVTVVDTLPPGLTATALTGTGWTCVLGTLTCTRTDVLAVSTSYAPITLTVNVAGNATTPQVNMANVSGGGDASPGNNTAIDSTVITGAPATPDLSITKSHVGNFTQGQAGATYTITVSNSAAAATNGSTVTVTDTLPPGLTATALTGTGWTCVLGTLTCTRTDVLAVSTSYAPITLTVNVAGNATTPQDNMATVTGGGDASPGNNTAIDSTVITGAPATPDLSITKSHVGNFTQGQIGATYTITVSNSAAAATNGTTVTVTDTLPAGLTATALTGTGWTCVLGTLTCTRTDVLAVSTSYAPITLTVNVAGNATTPQINMANVSGGGDASPGNNSASDSTTVIVAPAGTIQFATALPDQTVNENAGTATFNVSRSGGSSGAVSVTVTLGGTAANPADYTNTLLVLNWIDGDSADKLVTFTIVDDLNPESSETVTLSIGAPTGSAVVGAVAAATLTILDNDGFATQATPAVIPATSRWTLAILVLLMLGLVALTYSRMPRP